MDKFGNILMLFKGVTIRKNFNDILKIGRVINYFVSRSNSEDIKVCFFANISFSILENDSIIKSGGQKHLWVAIFWSDSPLRGQIGGNPREIKSILSNP